MTESAAEDAQRAVPPGAMTEPDPAEAERDPAAAGADATADPATLAHAVEATLLAAADGPGGLTSPEDEADAVGRREVDAVGPESVPEEMLAPPSARTAERRQAPVATGAPPSSYPTRKMPSGTSNRAGSTGLSSGEP
jgi:hypothetical protein